MRRRLTASFSGGADCARTCVCAADLKRVAEATA
jgi:hypothetical protein